MLRWAALFLVITLVAGLLGFAGVVGAASNIAWIIFVLFLVLFVVSLFMGGMVSGISADRYNVMADPGRGESRWK